MGEIAWRSLLPAALLALVMAPLALWLPSYQLGLLTQALAFGLMAASLDVLAGYAGLLSLGQAAFFGIGAYGVGMSMAKLGWQPWPAAGIALLAAATAATVFGLLVRQLRGPYFLVTTLTLTQVLWGLAVKWTPVTGGYDGLRGIARPPFLWDLERPAGYFLFTLLAVTVALAVMDLLRRSPLGLALQGVRQSERRMRVLGYQPSLLVLTAVLLAALGAGLAGVLHVFYQRFVGPSALAWTLSAQVLLSVIVGSRGTFWGPAAAGFALALLQLVLSDYVERWNMVIGALFVFSVLLAPEGLPRAVDSAIGWARGLLGGRAEVR